MKHLLFYTFFLISIISANAQELNCRVNINRSQVQGTNEDIFRSLRQDIYEFMNNRKWTNNVFANNERIECQIQLNITKFNGIDKFTANLSVQSSRTIYGTNYKSIVLNYKEKNDFEFTYAEGQPLEFNENTHISNLTSVLAFYAYIIIGLDYDTYGMLSGTEYFQKARTIMNNAQGEPDGNWKAFSSGDNNRYYLIENIVSNTNSGLRKFYYRYHRLGLDVMQEKLEEGRNEIANSFQLIKSVYNRKPNSNFLKIVLQTKMKEIVKIFSEAPMQEKKRVYNILKEVDPTNKDVDKIIETRN
ncbi:MAG: DUF4835 family protein [Chlorobi bacterium]|nr:DUF4835 family protein [Chlorobiota bacterium]